MKIKIAIRSWPILATLEVSAHAPMSAQWPLNNEVRSWPLGGHFANYLVLYAKNGDYLPIGISGLAPEDSVRLQKFTAERLKR